MRQVWTWSDGPMVKLVYFAWVRERIGKSGEQLEVPAEIGTVAELIDWLSARGPEYANAFARPEVIRTAIDHTHVKSSARIDGAQEIAFFPPVTGG